MATRRSRVDATRTCEPPEPGRDDVWAGVGGKTRHGVYSVADGWVEVIADNGLTRTARCGESSAAEIAERLLRELYRRGGGR